MEVQKCRFFKEGQPGSCKNGNKCPYAHDKATQHKKGEDNKHVHHQVEHPQPKNAANLKEK